jgi:uncharacterized protein YjbI with pentapeptide repeats
MANALEDRPASAGSVMSLPDEKPEPPATRGPPALAAKADDLEAIRTAVVDAAGISPGLWLTYLLLLFYLLIAAGGVTHRDLFLASPVKLPFLNVELPLTGFFWLGPALFLVMHAYVLLHFVLLASKIGVFDAQLRAQIEDTNVRAKLRLQLPINIFVQYLAGPNEARGGVIGFLLRLIAWISLVIGPVGVLVFFELQFLPYHNVWISWCQRIAVIIDLWLLWVLWPALLSGEVTSRWWRRIGWGTGSVLGCVSMASILLVLAIATFPGEWLQRRLSWFPLRERLVAGSVDSIARKPTSLWSNRLVLTGLDVIDHAKFDSEAKIAAAPEIASLRGRNLDGVVLVLADLRKVDFTGASLKGAWLQGAQLQGATLTYAQLQGASLDSAQLQGASLVQAQLQGASLIAAQLKGASLVEAQLQGAYLDIAQLQGATLTRAQLQGASLASAQLQGASLVEAQLQGASLPGAQLQGALLTGSFVWRADIREANMQGARIGSLQTGPKTPCAGLPGICDWTFDSLKGLKERIEREVYDRNRRMRQFESLDPTKPLAGEVQTAESWAKVEQAPSALGDAYEKELAELWRDIGCANDAAPFVLEGIVWEIAAGFARVGAQMPWLASEFLKKDCAGGRGMSERTRTKLLQLRDTAP